MIRRRILSAALAGAIPISIMACLAERPCPSVANPSNSTAPEPDYTPPPNILKTEMPGPPASASANPHAGHSMGGPVDSGAMQMLSCPMHPEVTSTTPGRCPKCGMTLVPTPTTAPKQ